MQSTYGLFRIHGICLSTNFKFFNPLPATQARPDVVFHHRDLPPKASAPAEKPMFTSRTSYDDGTPVLSVYYRSENSVYRFVFPRIGGFLLQDNVITGWCESDDTDPLVFEQNFIGPVFSLWMELNGIMVLHASSVVIDGRAVVFLGDSGSGKSSLAAQFLRENYDLVSDDVLALTVGEDAPYCTPSLPQIKLMPNTIALCGSSSGATQPSRGHKAWIPVESRFSAEDRIPLSAVYILPEPRNANSVEIDSLNKTNAFWAFSRFSFLSILLSRMELSVRRLSGIARLIESVPFYSLNYPDGMRSLPDVVDYLSNIHRSRPASKHSKSQSPTLGAETIG